MSAEEWDDTPWWIQDSYIEGLQAEGILVDGEEESAGQPSFEKDPVTASDDEFRAMGLTVINGGRSGG